MTTELHQASRNWANREADERFDNLFTMAAFMNHQNEISRERTVSSRDIVFEQATGDETYGMQVVNRKNPGKAAIPTNWAFGQACALAGAPAGYLKKLVAPLAADCINHGLHVSRNVEDVKLLFRSNGKVELAAATGPNYGRIPNADIGNALVRNFGNGRDGDWKVPGEFGKAVEVTKANTTLFASDRDMFVFLADEKNRIHMDGRRSLGMNKQNSDGSLARGFFVWNSEVGASTFGIAMFLFDYTCMNRIVWGVQGYRELKFRHTSGAPDKFVEQLLPVLDNYQHSSAKPVEDTLRAAQAAQLDTSVADFLSKRRYSTSSIVKVETAFQAEEQRPMETLWDVVTGITAAAKAVPYQDERVAMERDAGKILDLVAVR